MPATRLNRSTLMGRFDVLDSTRELLHSVKHIGLAKDACVEVSPNDWVPFIHKGPPPSGEAGPGQPQSWGTVPLTVDEENRIDIFY